MNDTEISWLIEQFESDELYESLIGGDIAEFIKKLKAADYRDVEKSLFLITPTIHYVVLIAANLVYDASNTIFEQDPIPVGFIDIADKVCQWFVDEGVERVKYAVYQSVQSSFNYYTDRWRVHKKAVDMIIEAIEKTLRKAKEMKS